MKRQPSGRIRRTSSDETELVLTRDFAADADVVWAAITESDRLARWIGTVTGDPASGRVFLKMTAEEAASDEPVDIEECDPPRSLAVTTHTGTATWRLRLTLTPIDGGTRLTFTQPGIDPVEAESVGPGWEYYLDRLVTAESGGDVGAIDFERDYYPAMADHYRRELGES
jgi:uncharacterized protein YndB with AHSA1/START domain